MSQNTQRDLLNTTKHANKVPNSPKHAKSIPNSIKRDKSVQCGLNVQLHSKHSERNQTMLNVPNGSKLIKNTFRNKPNYFKWTKWIKIYQNA